MNSLDITNPKHWRELSATWSARRDAVVASGTDLDAVKRALTMVHKISKLLWVCHTMECLSADYIIALQNASYLTVRAMDTTDADLAVRLKTMRDKEMRLSRSLVKKIEATYAVWVKLHSELD